MNVMRSPPAWSFHQFPPGLYGQNLSPTNSAADAYALVHSTMPGTYQHASMQPAIADMKQQPDHNATMQAAFHDPRSGNYPAQMQPGNSPRSTPTTSSETPGSLASSQGMHDGIQANGGGENGIVQNGMIITTLPSYPATNPFISGNGLTNNNYITLSPSSGLNLPFRHQQQTGFNGPADSNRPPSETDQTTGNNVGTYGYYRNTPGYEQAMMEEPFPGANGNKAGRQVYADISRLGTHGVVNGHHGDELDENSNNSTPKVWRPY
eukprot:gene384-1017_t